ncbi:hypothetical protein SH668x_002771 [Planctomicrobium sp. SH668]|uniref:hypothetical protein n=1 Tax=Planctomicrobium sp. SH668 TaxID=3448126 RepID=UPI003F5CB326
MRLISATRSILKSATTSLLFTLAIAACGCGGGGGAARPTVKDVQGEITLNGKPIDLGVVVLVDEVNGTGASAEIVDGAFKFENPVQVGDYVVEVRGPKAPPPHLAASAPKSKMKIPDIYTKSGRSPLKVSVSPSSTTMKLELK